MASEVFFVLHPQRIQILKQSGLPRPRIGGMGAASCHNSPRLDFDTVIDWRERQILLKAAFPVEVLAPTATYEIQSGNVERPTHRNTT